jgi:hypothetical protein
MRALAILLLLLGLVAACASNEPEPASSGATAVQQPTDLGFEAEKEEARIRSGGSATSQSR